MWMWIKSYHLSRHQPCGCAWSVTSVTVSACTSLSSRDLTSSQIFFLQVRYYYIGVQMRYHIYKPPLASRGSDSDLVFLPGSGSGFKFLWIQIRFSNFSGSGFSTRIKKYIRIRYVQRGWIRIQSVSDRIRNPACLTSHICPYLPCL